MRLHTPYDREGYKNSILTFQHIRDAEFRRLLAKPTVVYRRDGL